MANFAKTDIKVSFKIKILDNPENPILILRIYFKKYIVWRKCKALFFSRFLIPLEVTFFPKISLKLIKSLRGYQFLLIQF